MKIDFIHLETIDSTNTWAKKNAASFHTSHLTCITAQEQTGGRGRQDKKWLSPKDANLYTTLYFTAAENAPYLSNLGQIMAFSCAQVLLEMGVPIQLKWPNDLLIHKKKVGGVLSETFIQKNCVGVALGLGLNVNMPESILESIDQPATSLHLILHKELKPLSLLEPFLKQFISDLKQLQESGFAPFQKQFNELLAYKGEQITVQLPQKKIQGICESITPEGRLQLRLSDGEFLLISAGEIV
ncbi:MAG: biotin--[acetyl-CoA-carboxylase] ligase [Rhabdochlamydiaceae bacterium]|nr:biotin--[acetyl-CoA-carboxylase] ligase [Rhabdochlamydiaceae bacterium]